jgi:NitT/TauT family transport system permease protein
MKRLVSPGVLLPVAVAVGLIGYWEWYVRSTGIAPYILPAPSAIWTALITGWSSLWPALITTLQVTFGAFAAATILGALLAILFTQSRWIEMSLFPYAVILQVTPIVAIAPLIIIWTKDQPWLAVLICAWLVAFFPVLSNATLGLRSTDHNLLNLFELYGANRFQQLWYLRIPNALPYFLGGLRIAGGLALIGAVVAEFVAGAGGSDTGLAYRILESGYRLQIPRMFAALLLISATGIAIFLLLTWLSWALLHKWHESAARREN